MASIQQHAVAASLVTTSSAGELVELLHYVDGDVGTGAAVAGPDVTLGASTGDAAANLVVGAFAAGALAQPLRGAAIAVDGGQADEGPAETPDTANAVAQLLSGSPVAGAGSADADPGGSFEVEFSAPIELPQGDAGSGVAVDVAVADGSAQRPERGPMPWVAEGDDLSLSAELGAALPVYTVDQIGNYLRQGFWDWFDGGVNYRSFNMASSGTGANSGTLYYNYSGFSGLTGAGTDSNGISAARQALVDDALDYIGELFGITFIATTSQATHVDLFFMDNDSGAYSNSTLFGSGNGTSNHRYIDYSWVNIEPGWSGGTSDINDYTYQTLIHEIGHAIGLGHGGQYNGSATYVTDTTTPGYGNNTNIYLNDSWQQSIMSYVDQDENTYIPAATSYSFVISFMAGDFQALRSYYGSGEAFNGNTVYGFNTNILTSVSEVFANLATYGNQTAFSIIDSSGIDTVDFSGYAAASRIDLTIASGSSTTGTISNIGGRIGNMTLGVGTVIENAVGGSGSDTIIGNTSSNSLTGNGGNDTITGGSGNDTLNGGTGADNMDGGSGDDVYVVDNAGDIAAETGGGVDRVQSSITWTLSTNIENLTLTGTINRNGTGNALSNVILGNTGINTLSGLGGNDSIEGDSGDDVLLGGDGNDTLAGESGTDSVNGGAGDDLIRFTSGHFYDSVDGGTGTDTLDASAVSRNGDTFDFELGVISGYPGGQTVAGIEIFLGGQGDETIISSGTGGTYHGNGGNDLMVAEIGAETMDGGAGTDTIDLSRYSGAYAVDMSTGASNFFFESYVNFENLISGAGDDSITGTAGDNDIRTDGGNDTVIAGGGEDTVYGGAGNDLLQGGFVTDFVYGEAGDDIIRVLAGEFYDNVDGGADVDTLDHTAATYSGTTFDFELQQITGTGVNATAFLRNIELYQDGSGDNTIVSDGNGNAYYGNGGDDYMIAEIGGETMDGGVGGSDTIDLSRWNGSYTVDLTTGSSNYGGELFTNFENLISGNGNDSITGTSGSNAITTNGGNDTVNAGAGLDTVDGGSGNDTFVDTETMGVGDSDVYDGGAGTDTLIHDVSWASSVVFNLITGWATVNGGNRDQLISIENLTIGGSASIVGSAASNVLIVNGSGTNDIQGGAGNDTIDAGGGNDTINAGAGSDSVVAGAGNDVITDTEVMLDTEDDVYDGGAGTDTLVHEFNWVPSVIFNLTTGFTTLDGNNRDQLISIENLTVGGSATVIGSASPNVLIVTGNGDNLIRGETGNDTIDGGGGDDTIDGGVGIDTASYATAGSGVVVSLSDAGPQFTGGAGTDTLIGVEWLMGSTHNDVLTGNAGANRIDGGIGNDVMIGGDGNDTYVVDSGGDVVVETNADVAKGGDDWVLSYVANYTLSGNVERVTIMLNGAANATGNWQDNVIYAGSGNNVINGQGGMDTVSYLYASVGVSVSLGLAGAQATGGSGSDTLVSIERVTGSAHADVLTGTGGANVIDGGAGADQMTGGDGDDTYVVDNIGDVVTEANPVLATGGRDLVQSALPNYVLGANVEDGHIIAGGAANLAGNGLDNLLHAGSGSNVIDGQGGSDTVSYVYSAAGVTVNLAVAGPQATGGSGSDTLLNVEHLSGSRFNDTLTGDAGDNVINGGGGLDRLIGGGGADTLTGGDGADKFVLDNLLGSDTITDFTSELDDIVVSRSSIPIGDGDSVVEGSTTTAGPGGFLPTAELVVITGNVVGAINAVSAAAAIGSASAAYAIGRNVLFAVDNGADSAVFLFGALDADALVSDTELSLLAMLNNTPSTSINDYLWGS